MPSRYRKAYPITGGHSYEIRSIPWATWHQAHTRAALDDVGMRTVCIRLLEYYADHGLPVGYEAPEPPPQRASTVARRERVARARRGVPITRGG